MSDETPKGFFNELKRRNVYRVALAYFVGAWLLIQIAETVFPYVGLPDRAVTIVIVLCAIGFVPTMVFAWAFEITPEGVRREADIDRDDAYVVSTARKLNVAIVSVLSVALAFFAVTRLMDGTEAEPPPVVDTDRPSIAVLPFENRSANPDDVYFVDGVHDDILSSLSNIGSLRVIARTSVERFRNTQKSIREIAAELNVTAILEGGVQRAGDSVRISVRLVEAATEDNRWTHTFNEELTTANIFSIQSQVARTIADRLQSSLTVDEEKRIDRRPTESLRAYEAYLLGNQRLKRLSRVAIEQAIEYFEEAVELDPEFALGWVGLADGYTLLQPYGGRLPEEVREPAIDSAERAIELDQGLGEAYFSLGIAHHVFKTGEAPEPLILRSIELNPNYAPARGFYSRMLTWEGRYDDALLQSDRALELDPLSPELHANRGTLLLDMGRLEDSRVQFLRSIEIDPEFEPGYTLLASYYTRTGQIGDALLTAEKARSLNPSSIRPYFELAYALVNVGDFDEADRAVEKIYELSREIRGKSARAYVHFARHDAAAVEAARQTWQNPNYRGYNRLILKNHYLESGRFDDAKELYEREAGRYALPSDRTLSALSRFSAWTALDYAGVLKKAGRTEDASAWIELLLRFYDEQMRVEMVTNPLDRDRYQELVFLTAAHALNGDKEAALAAMRRAVDSGWINNWFYRFDHDPNLDLIRDEPAFQAMKAVMQDKMNTHLEAYRAARYGEP